jgi:integrase
MGTPADPLPSGAVHELARRADLLLIGSQSYISPELADMATRAVELETAELEPSSRRTYRYLTRDYERFCDGHGLDAFVSSSVRLYLVDRVEAAEPRATLRNRINAIRRMAHEAGRPDPTDDPGVRKSLKGAVRAIPIREPRRVAPATYESLQLLVDAIEAMSRESVRPQLEKQTDAAAMLLRDRALVLLGFALGRRGSELARVDLEHIEWRPDGLLIKIPYSKTNKSGEPEVVGVPKFVGDPLCPVAALAAWVHYAKVTAGPVFVTLSPLARKRGNRMAARDISRRLEAIAAKAGLPGIWRSHSLRRGVVTSAEAAGVARSRTRLLTGWKSDAMFSVYADHQDKIAQSPLHDLYRTR